MVWHGIEGNEGMVCIHNSAHSYIRSTREANKTNKQHLPDWNEGNERPSKRGEVGQPNQDKDNNEKNERASFLPLHFIYFTPNYKRQ